MSKNLNYSKDEIDLKIVSQEHRLIRILLNLYNYRGDKVLFFASLKALLWCIFGSRTIGITIVGLLTLFFANKANDLLQKQNYLVESARRNTLVIEFSEVMNQLQKEYNSIDTTSGELSDLLLARIKSLSNSYKPYRYLDMDGELIDSPISPERAQLLFTLIEGDKNSNLLSNFLSQCNFQYADLSDREEIKGKVFNNVDLSHSKWDRSTLKDVYFDTCIFNNASFKGDTLTSCDFGISICYTTNFENTSLTAVDLEGCFFDGVNFINSNFDRVFLPSIDSFGVGGNEKNDFTELACSPCYVKNKDWLSEIEIKKENFIGWESFIKRHKITKSNGNDITLNEKKSLDYYQLTLRK